MCHVYCWDLGLASFQWVRRAEALVEVRELFGAEVEEEMGLGAED